MVALLPARGGSKGLPKKNLRSLAGKPLIIWTIEAAQKSQQIDHIVLSTDDKEIADICRSTGIDIPFMRPKELAQDDSIAIDNYIYTIDRLNNAYNYNYNEFSVLLPTTPLRNSFDIDGAISVFHENNADSVISVSRLHFPVDWILNLNEDNTININKNKNLMMNRQKYKQSYLPNGGIYVLRNELLKKNRSYYSKYTFPFIMPHERSVDIDSENDFVYAEYLLKRELSHAR